MRASSFGVRARGFLWCPHCKGPHVLGTTVCEATAKVIDGSMHVSRVHPLTGTMLANTWRLIRHLGTGGMGEVFEAEHVRMRRRVAIKLVRARTARDGSARMLREAEILSSMQHPNICAVYDLGEMNDGTPFIVLELLTGQTLASRIARSGPLAPAAAFDIFTQILSALHSAHCRNVIHRDLKPQNIFLGDRVGMDPIPKLMDFGLAKDVSGGKTSITARGKIVGTQRYMAPEQLRGERIDARADIFAAGITLYEALTGKHPFGSAPLEIQVGILREEAKLLSASRPDLPDGLSHVIMQALRKAPADRFSSALAMQNALRVALAPSAVATRYGAR